MTIQLHKLQDYVDQTLATYQVPAFSVAVWQNGDTYQAAGGCLNLNTGVKATTDSIFQIGSVTKVMTACLVMKLVERGRLVLDAPVQHYLPDFSLADPKAAAQITVRQLINHSNGIAGDFFPYDRGHQGNLIARFVDRCCFGLAGYAATTDLGRAQRLGEQINTGFLVVVGTSTPTGGGIELGADKHRQSGQGMSTGLDGLAAYTISTCVLLIT